MADFIRGAFGVSRTGSDRRPDNNRVMEPGSSIIAAPKPMTDKERLHASPSTGSDDTADLGLEEFDPFGTSQTDGPDDIDGSNAVTLIAPPEKEYVPLVCYIFFT